jgi:hypothetical protein
MPWWLWLIVAVVAFLALMFTARSSWRRSVRAELLAVLKEKHPDVRVAVEREDSLDLELPGDVKGTLNLDNLYSGLAMGAATDAERREAIEAFAEGCIGQVKEASGPLRLDTHGDRLLPRLVGADLLRQVPAGEPLPHTLPGIPGLVTAYVLDSEMSVMYLTESHRLELGLELAALHEKALANLRRTFPAMVVRQSVEKQQVNVMKAGDTFDATRLLLVPEELLDDEELAAAIPDRETLVLSPVPPDGNWETMRKLARTPASPYTLLDRPVRVKRSGFEIV